MYVCICLCVCVCVYTRVASTSLNIRMSDMGWEINLWSSCQAHKQRFSLIISAHD